MIGSPDRKECVMRLLQALAAVLFMSFSLVGAAAAQESSVGFQRLSIPDGAGPAIEIAIWYPSNAPASPQPLELFTQTVAANGAVAGTGLPLVVISHGNGGSLGGHYDTALALARAGFVVAALEHTGDNYHDASRATDMANRPRQLHVLIDYMLDAWPSRGVIDPQRIGAFGFSSGGFTVLVAAGGEPDLRMVAPHCTEHPKFFDCGLVAAHPVSAASIAAMRWVHDPRLKAVVVAGPALGYAFAPNGLKNVTAKIDLWRDEDDHILPNPYYAETVRTALPTLPSYHVVPHMDHFDFLAPCTDALAKAAPFICKSEPGFDRAAFHAAFDREVVAFFASSLKN
jgi:predicted dienelactone hydrolase